MTSIAAKFYVILRNTSFEKVAQFDSWTSLQYTKNLNGVDSYSLGLEYTDPRIDLFTVDSIIEIYRSVPGSNLDWYQEFVGFHRKEDINLAENGRMSYVSSGVGINELLSRRIINYYSATIKSQKSAPSETVMKEYVDENCGSLATVSEGRIEDGAMPSFFVEADSKQGKLWEGDRAFESLMDVIKDVAKFSDIDFGVFWDSSTKMFVFRTFKNQMGVDRTVLGIDTSTGKNSTGNVPTIFSVDLGNVSSLSFAHDRMSEITSVSILGEGEGPTREVVVRSSDHKIDSPWNLREIARPKNGFLNEMNIAGDEALAEMSAKEIVSFKPLLQSNCMYGKHFLLGDRISVRFRGERSKRIISVQNTVGISESLSIGFSDTII